MRDLHTAPGASPTNAPRKTCLNCEALNDGGNPFCISCGLPMPRGGVGVATRAPAPFPPGPQASAVPVAGHSGLGGLGWFLLVAGFAAMLIGAFLPTTITTDSTYVLGSRIGGEAVHNMGLIARNLMFVLCGGFAAVTGAVFVAADR